MPVYLQNKKGELELERKDRATLIVVCVVIAGLFFFWAPFLGQHMGTLLSIFHVWVCR